MEAPMTKPTLSDPITLRIPEDVLADIETIAQATERSRSWVIVRALRTYLQQEGAEILAYRRGLDEVASGEVEDLDEVVKDLKRIASDKVA
jgi:predicted transcriptional regulator